MEVQKYDFDHLVDAVFVFTMAAVSIVLASRVLWALGVTFVGR